MKTIRIIATIALGVYFAAMALQFAAISIELINQKMSPFEQAAPPAFFTNSIVCILAAFAIWLLWRKRLKGVEQNSK